MKYLQACFLFLRTKSKKSVRYFVLHPSDLCKVSKVLTFQIMSTSKQTCCTHCGRDTFRSQRGLTQHLDNHRICSQLEKERHANQEKKRSGDVAMLDDLEVQKHAVGNAIAAMLDEDELARKQMEAGGKQNLQMDAETQAGGCGEEDESDDGFVATLGDDSVQLQDETADLSDDNQEQEDDEQEQVEANEDDLDGDEDGPCTESQLSFAECCACAQQHYLPLDEHHVTAIKLMTLLRHKKAPLDTYDAVMEWHLRENGILQPHESLRHARDRYIGRKTLFKFLKERYHMEGKLTVPRPVVLPASKAKVVLRIRKAQAMVESLLTDPRWRPQDFLFFNEDPFAPPPDNLDCVCDLNTGESCLQTCKKLIKDPSKEILIPTPIYTDGAIADQCSKLEIEALQMTIGILDRHARDKRHAWKTLGYFPSQLLKRKVQGEENVSGQRPHWRLFARW